MSLFRRSVAGAALPLVVTACTGLGGLVGGTTDSPGDSGSPEDAPSNGGDATVDTSAPPSPLDAAPDNGCAAGFAPCGPNAVCTNVAADPYNCGSCGHTCGAPNTKTAPTCVKGACVFDCAPGFGNCNGNDFDGCEADTTANPASCGACGHSCLGGACKTGACQEVTLVTNESAPWGIAVDATDVYWASWSASGHVARCAKGGCNGNAVQIVSAVTLPMGIALDGTDVYWTTNPAQGAGVFRCAKATCPVVSTVTAIADVGSLWLSGTSLYLNTSNSPGSIMTCDVGFCQPSTITSSIQNITFTAVDSGRLYWTTNGLPGTIVSCAVPGCNGQTVLYSGNDYPWGIAFDATNIYFTTYQNPGTIKTCPKTDCSKPITLVSGQSNPLGIAVDATAIYWTTLAGDIKKLAK